MNVVLENIRSRRSIRFYETKLVGEGEIRNLLEAAMAAPSAVGKDPWRFLVVREKKTLAQIAGGLPNGSMIAKAALGIVVCGDLSAVHAGELSYLLQDCAAAIENILLAAQSMGLGACWLGVHPREERIACLRQILGIPKPVIPVACISIGYPMEKKESRTRYKEDYIHWEKW